MFRFSFFLLTLLSVVSGEARPWEAEARVGYMQPRNDTTREIFSDGWAQYQVQIAARIYGPFSLWASGAINNANGHSIGLREKTTLRLYPIGFGGYLRFCLPSLSIPGSIDGYIGAGANYSVLRIHDYSDIDPQNRNAHNWGGILKSAIRYHFCGCGYIGAFVDYAFSDFNLHDSAFRRGGHFDVGGFIYGASLGFSFQL